MSEENKKKDTHPVPDLSRTFDDFNACSPMDCTGSVPRPPQTSAELDSYLDTYNFLPQASLVYPNDVTIDVVEAEKEKR